jgi:hypothetical protein
MELNLPHDVFIYRPRDFHLPVDRLQTVKRRMFLARTKMKRKTRSSDENKGWILPK